MILFSRTAFRAAQFGVLALLAASCRASGAPVQSRQTAPASGASGDIIALPLALTIPAAQRSCAAKTPSGIGFTILRASTGAKPAADATVLVNYIGYLAANGAVFDQAMRAPMPVSEVIPGFSQGLQLLTKSSVARICIPAAMAYGAQASGPIPANSDLVFQVELLDFKTAAEIAELSKARAVKADAAGTPPQP